MKTMFLAALIALAAPGCGSHHHDAAHAGHDDHHAHHEDGKGHAAPTGSVKELHDAFAPLWHMPKGSERTSKTCDAVPQLLELTAKVAAEPGEARQAAAKELGTKLEAVKGDCGKEARVGFDILFADAHDALHRLMEAK